MTGSYRCPIAVALLCLVFAVLSGSPVSAQDRLDPVGMGKGRASVASVRDLGAVYSNPGALDLRSLGGLDGDLQVSLYTIGFTLGSTLFSSEEFNQIFGRTEGWPSNEDRQRLGELLQDERLYANSSNSLLTALYRTNFGTFGLHYSHRLFSRINFPGAFKRILTEGQLFDPQYEFFNQGIGASYFTEVGLSYGLLLSEASQTTSSEWFPMIGLGTTVKLVMGVGQFDVADNSLIRVDRVTTQSGAFGFRVRGGYVVRFAEPENFAIADAVSSFQSALFPSTSGTGVAFDAGISGVLYRQEGRDLIYFGATVHDIGTVKWNGVTTRRKLSMVDDILPNATLGSEQFDRYQGVLDTIDPYSTALPSVLRAGLALDVGGLSNGETELMVDVEGETPLNSIAGNPDEPRVSVGGDWHAADWLWLRTGMSMNAAGRFGLGLGAGFRIADWLRFDVGTSELNAMIAGDRIDISARLSAGFTP